MEEFKHVCRICKKRFPSGKSLGGHMRSHVIAEARKNKLLNLQNNNKVSNFIVNNHVNDDDDDDDDHEDDDDDDDVDEDDDHEINRNSGYGLRENPKKTWRIVNSNYNYNYNISSNNHNISNNNDKNQEKLRVCDQCGKGFNSMKALCGHMSIHSNNNNNNNMDTDFRSTHFTNRNNNNNKNEEDEDDNSWCSDSIDQLYLAMDSHSSDNININNNINSKRLTRSSVNGNGGGSSSNHSEIDQLEQEEVAMCLMMLSRDSSGSNYKNNGNGFEFRVSESSDNNSVILEGGLKVGRVVIKGKSPEMVNSDSGYFEYGAKELESDASVDGFVRNKRKIRDLGESNENYSSKKIRNDYFYSSNNTDTNTNTNNRKYQCPICNKSYKTHQALGGHIISHRKNSENTFETSNNHATTSKKGNASKKVKGHKCPFCLRVFKSGQALGGHKRSHMMGSNNVVLHSTRVVEPEPELKQPLIDLNLPAPLEEEASGNSQFMSW